MIIEGKAHVFGDSISTDQIAPGRYYHLRSDLPRLARHVLEDADADFAARVRPGDLVVAGENFGLGSSREHAAAILKLAGVAGILARSVARIFFRNAINVGLPCITVETSAIRQGHVLRVDLERGTVSNLSLGVTLRSSPLPPVMLGILNDGGLVAHVIRHGGLAVGRGTPDA